MTDTPTSQHEDVRQAEVVSDHLPSGYTSRFEGTSIDGGRRLSGSVGGRQLSPAPAPAQPSSLSTSPELESSLKLQGGDIHRNIFKIENRARLNRRAQTFAHPLPRRDDDVDSMTASEVQEPQGFRRQFVRSHRSFVVSEAPVARNFVEFLDLYGAFAGEDLAESDDEAAVVSEDEERQERPNETRPLLAKRKSSRRQPKGDAGTTKTFFTLLKAFIGTGIMFLPKAFNNGGMLFSAVTLIFVSIISMICFHLLLSCRSKYGIGYGDIGKNVAGPKMRGIILFSITLSQLGFFTSAMVFVAQNLLSFCDAVANGPNPIGMTLLICLQAVVLIPFSFIRNISKLGPAALLADILIMIGLIYIWYYDIAVLATQGLHPTVVLFNPSAYTQTIGSAIFTFEGIGLILPIQSSMKKPEKFEWVLGSIMLLITAIFTSVGALCYAAFGNETSIEVLKNFPQDNKFVNAVQFLYSIAVLIGTPVQLFPPIRIMEGLFFKNLSGKKDAATKWKKNAFRTFMVILCTGVAIGGSGDLDKFVSLIGSFACVPLVYIYPPLLHYLGIASTWYEKLGDILLMMLGGVCMVYTTTITLKNSFL